MCRSRNPVSDIIRDDIVNHPRHLLGLSYIIKEKINKGLGFYMTTDGLLMYQNRICVLNDEEIKKLILEEAHFSLYSVHPGGTKMYRDLKGYFWWNGMKQDVAEFVERCSTCQQVKWNIRNLQDCCNLWRYQYGNGRQLLLVARQAATWILNL
jgi:hypothetical protein